MLAPVANRAGPPALKALHISSSSLGSFSSTITDDHMLPPLVPSTPSHSPSPAPYNTADDYTADDFLASADPSTPSHSHGRGRYQRRWMSMSSPSHNAQQQREREKQHLSKLQAMPTAVAPSSAVDFTRADVSVLSQLLMVAADEVSGRHAISEKGEDSLQRGLTAIKCVPTEEILHTIQSKRRQSLRESMARGRGSTASTALTIATQGKRSSAERIPSSSSPMSPTSPTSALSPTSFSAAASSSHSTSSASSFFPANSTFSASMTLPSINPSAANQPTHSNCSSSPSAATSPSLPVHSLSSYPAVLAADSNLRLVGDATLVQQRHAVYAANLTYPLTWCPTLHLAPYHIDAAQLSEQEVIDWCLSVFGSAVVTEAVKARLLALESARWAAFLAPFASDEYVTLMGRFLALFVIIDDQLIEQAVPLGLTTRDLLLFAEGWRFAADRRAGNSLGTHEAQDKVRQLGAKLGLPLLDASYEAIWNLSDSYAALGADQSWCARMAATWCEYTELGVREAIAADRLNKVSSQVDNSEPLPAMRLPLTRYDHPSIHAASSANGGKLHGVHVLEVLARQRVATIGLPMMVLQLERACGLCLSSIDSLLAPAVQILSIIPALVNELVGLARDLREGDNLISTNFSLVQRRLFQCSLAHSIDFTVALHDHAVSAFDVCCGHILAHPLAAANPSLTPRLAVYLDRLRQCVRGYAQWHHHAARYKSVIAVDVTERLVFIFPVHDGHTTQQKESAIHDTLLQYHQHTQQLQQK